jgi:hypothetical protein
MNKIKLFLINKIILKMISETNDYEKIKKNLNIELFKKLIFLCDINITNKDGYTPLMFLLKNNKTQNIHLKSNDIYGLLQKCNVNQKDNYVGFSIISYLLSNNKSQNIQLESDQIYELLQKCDLKTKGKHFDHSENIIVDIIRYNYSENLNLNKKQIKSLIEKCSIEEQQEILKYIVILNENGLSSYKNIHFYIKDLNHKYQQEIEMLVYDCEINIKKQTLDWLESKQYKKALKTIEKKLLMNNLTINPKKEKIKKI